MASFPFTTPQCSHFRSTKTIKSLSSNEPIHFTEFNGTTRNHRTLSKSYFHSISSLCKDGQIQQAVDLLTEMDSKNFPVGPEIYGEILQGCVYERDLFTGQQIHAQVLKNGAFFARNEYIETKLVIFYAKCGAFDVANNLFSRLRVTNVFSWAAIIGLKCRVGLNEEALMAFSEMQENGFFPDNFVVPNALKACGALLWLGYGKGVHGYVAKVGFDGCVFVASSLIDMYGKCGALEDARKVFDGMVERNVIAWNSMIVGYMQNGRNEEAIGVFYDMRMEGVEPTQVSISSFLSASANLGAIDEGKQGHAIAVVGGLELDNILGSSVINFYSKLGLIEDAELVFVRMLVKDVVTWNLMISSYVRCGLIEKALNMCHLMRLENLRFDCVTLSSILTAAANSSSIEIGKEGHCYCIRNNLQSDVVVSSSIVDMYAKCGRIDCARQVFSSTTNKDVILWNTLLASYADVGHSGEALKLFYQMQLQGVPPNVTSWNSVILGFIRNHQLNEAKELFLQMQSLDVHPNLITWTTLITGLAHNGFQDESVQIFQKMQESGIKPNTISISSVLSACTNVTSLQHGRAIHGYAIRHDLDSQISVSTALVGMYAKCGYLSQAKRVFDNTLSKELPVYNAMISCYALHGQAGEALVVYKHLEEAGIEPDGITFTSVLSACSHTGLINEGLEIFFYMVSKHHFRPSMEHYGCIVSLLSRSGNLDEAIRLIRAMPYEPDAHIIGSLLAACREHNEIELGEHLSKYLLELEPDNSGNYVAISNAYAASGRWDEVIKIRDLMKEKGLKKSPGCSWIQIGEKLHPFLAGDGSHPKTMQIHATLALLGIEMHFSA
ncbi:Tetratricopeptide repeat (TPR)-like superfamily protein isoform 1 [Theobroma cacao]|uniref:Tetratricopeptide repeat (TPR)-like superfamily protein isoform 1 n=1 Tax=Theobroma cacao TaxID=3641 RepID=A0A061GP33_THECC|nr:Tetratricopeptide repeat (TPR)-like superfamily protein isoform 1 [Theobroma cacao]